MKARLKIGLRYLLLIIFLAYYSSITLFTHSHIVDGNVIITHSHPYKHGTSSVPVSHHHSKNEFLLIQLLSNLLISFSALFACFTILLPVIRKLKLYFKTRKTTIPRYFVCTLRGPPQEKQLVF